MKGQSVLLVEDDIDIADAICDVLRDEGYEFFHALNGKDALALLEKGCLPSLILLDLMMPVMDGSDFRKAQMADPQLAEIPVVVMSADRLAAETSRQLGVEGHLAKPIHPDQIIDAIKQYAREARLPNSQES